MNHADVAEGLTRPKRELLLEHIDGGAFIPAPISLRLLARRQTMESLINAGLIRKDGYKSPRQTLVTEDGRMVMAFVLASYAEALIGAGYTVKANGATAISEVAARAASPVPLAATVADPKHRRIDVGAD
jgi:hypothetical protein